VLKAFLASETAHETNWLTDTALIDAVNGGLGLVKD
jgi:hypothetical protein